MWTRMSGRGRTPPVPPPLPNAAVGVVISGGVVSGTGARAVTFVSTAAGVQKREKMEGQRRAIVAAW